MVWEDIAFDVFAFHLRITIIILALYFVPLVRILTLPLEAGHPFLMRINKKLGQWEHMVSWFRDTVVVVYLLGFAVWNLSFGIYYYWPRWIIMGAAALSLIVISVLNLYWKKKNRGQLLDFVRHFPTINPSEFFAHLICCAGGVRHKLPAAPYHTINPEHVDFRNSRKAKAGLKNIIVGIWSTIWLAKLLRQALKSRGRRYLREVASSLAVVWGTRLLSLAYAEMIIEGCDKLNGLHGSNIYLFNHLSFFDFAIIPLIMAARTCDSKDKHSNLPRFLVAKDHFIDNPIFHHVLGIGKVAQETGMIFVERRGREEEARRAIQNAAQVLVHEGADIAIFPQGSRGYGRVGPQGERIDPGYYVVGGVSRLKRDGDHLKKGAAHLAVNAATALMMEGIQTNVNLVPVAIKGTGIVVPKGSLRLIPNTTIKLIVGETVAVRADEVAGITDDQSYNDFVRRLHKRIDHVMKTTLKVHADLERRFFEDMRNILEPLYIEEMAVAMKPWRGDDFLIHAILDLIYTCPRKYWRSLLGRLIHLVRSDVPREELLDFKAEIAEKMFS